MGRFTVLPEDQERCVVLRDLAKNRRVVIVVVNIEQIRFNPKCGTAPYSWTSGNV